VNDLSIDRLTLRLSGLTASEGRRFAAALAECLAEAHVPDGARGASRLRVTLAARSGESLEAMARRVVAELSATLGGAA
jgi:hypothetical protein